ncbi:MULTISPECIES: IclR family transcriptional regulator [unclassified Microbacterium]|uniref:IclR family transcriptional regulator n=1 Tax=unclassified Microbacterium TaxID=2609290 RepID=UPI00214C13E1|nr:MULTISPECIES: IclR family transcriptional regulator [unclassified Microbacterium]MCR2783571.1 IclR family transcriptional regulator [Microbacterium sp. zg.B96]MDL5351658.1 IclR family transcriptional regulator [Microbacterium sp. zg-YB36]WIM15569.1 IclR family transcriptional regulator [Microbacterium sp. zg-B96]
MEDPAGPAPAARHTLEMLRHLSAQRGPVTAASIATALSLPRSTVYRLLGVMAEYGFVLHFPEERRYGIGLAAFEISSGFSRQEPLTRLGGPILAALVDRVGESGHLAVLHGRDVIYLIEERAPRRPSLVTEVGVRLPSHLTASGRALLATLPKSQLRALFPDPSAFTQRTDQQISGYAALGRLMAQVRAHGYATEHGDITPGLASIAVAVRDHTGWPAASIAVTFDAALPEETVAAIRQQVTASAADLSRRIHGRPISATRSRPAQASATITS